MTILVVLHDRLSGAIPVFAFVCAVWGVWAYWRRRAVSGNYWGTLVIGELLVIVQGLIGLVMLVAGMHLARTVHLSYGVMAALAWPAAYVYTQGRDERCEMLIYGSVSFLVVVFAVRATMTA
jgi:hypothetical protein